MKKVSVVTPSLNQARFIEEAILSVKSQDYPDVEHVIIDGGSTDDTVEILKKFSHLRWISEPDEGQTNALNKGFKMATGEIIGWLNSDERYRPMCFRNVVETFTANPEIDILYGDYAWIDGNGRVLQRRREIDFNYFILLYHKVCYIHSAATFFRRKIFDEGNFLDEVLDYAMDYEFFVRLITKGYKIRRIPKFLADFRWHSESKSTLMAARQREERDRITRQYSSIFNKSTVLDLTGMKILRAFAGTKRYWEKAIRGYYFTQFLGGSKSG